MTSHFYTFRNTVGHIRSHQVENLKKDTLKFLVTNLTGNGVQVANMSTDEMIDLLSKHPTGRDHEFHELLWF